MNRRTVLRTAGVVATVGLSGCVEALQEHYEGSFQGVVPVDIYSEADRPYDLTLEAFDPETDRQTYDESYTITAGQRATPPHLDATEQRLRVTKIDREQRDRQVTKRATITQNTSSVVIRLTDDDLRLEVEGDDEERRPNDGDASTNESATDTSE
ncbi:hypothetical protein BDK88_1846 [Natrinema hispanicum]|uniref:Uncharacterized protein n=1 Tax=Natrinema hispanicum TaxID=392421 RepID=A0A482YCQ2_9EURY|nr:hypothetical protein [Natrinema hispanicum]RZV10670.1 hypothetical protein BDK88_1846 [Natrinema hispanicum]